MWFLICAALAEDERPVAQQKQHAELDELTVLIKKLEEKKVRDCAECPEDCTCQHDHVSKPSAPADPVEEAPDEEVPIEDPVPVPIETEPPTEPEESLLPEQPP